MSPAFPRRERRSIALGQVVGGVGQAAHVEIVQVASGEMPFLSLLDVDGLFLSEHLSRARECVRLYGAIRDLAVHLGPATGRRMVDALAAIDPTFAAVTAPAIAMIGGGAPVTGGMPVGGQAL